MDKLLDINPQHCLSTTDRLLYNIYVLLQEPSKAVEKQEPIIESIAPPEPMPMLKCSKCGEGFENKGFLMAHSKKCKMKNVKGVK